MYRGKKIIGFIPARGGSVGIPKKNVYPIAGKPLISYTVESAAQSDLLDAVYCSTNDDEIAAVVSSAGTCGIIRRPEELCHATSPTIEAVLHALDVLVKRGEHFDYLMILQPTAPLRQARDIDGCIRYTIDNDRVGCVSVSRLHDLPVLMRYIEDNGAVSSVVPGCGTCRRQDARPLYYVDGCLYMWSVPELLSGREKISLNDAPFGYQIDAESAFDINEMQDIPLCEYLLKRRSDES